MHRCWSVLSTLAVIPGSSLFERISIYTELHALLSVIASAEFGSDGSM